MKSNYKQGLPVPVLDKNNIFSFPFKKRREKGVALVQVLLMVSMLLILTVQLSLQSKQQVRTSTLLKQKSLLSLQMDSDYEKVAFHLLTQTQDTNSQHFSAINRYGKYFTLGNGVEMSVQDEAGLVSFAYFPELVQALLISQGYEQPEAVAMTQQLQLQQGTSNIDGDNTKSAFLQHLQELNHIPGWSSVELPHEWVSYLPLYNFNPAVAPDKLLNQLFEGEKAQALVELRNSKGSISPFDLLSLNIGAGQYNIEPGSIFRVRIRAKFMHDFLYRDYKIEVFPDRYPPLMELGF